MQWSPFVLSVYGPPMTLMLRFILSSSANSNCKPALKKLPEFFVVILSGFRYVSSRVSSLDLTLHFANTMCLLHNSNIV